MILQECLTDSTTDGNVKILPAVLIKLENELGTPKNLPNKSKFLGKDKAKWLRKLIGNSFEGQELLQSVDSYVSEFEKKIDHCKSWSPYLIGFQVTIADLIVLYMVVTLFQKVCFIEYSIVMSIACYLYLKLFTFERTLAQCQIV